MNLTRAAITRPIFIFMLVIGAIMMGLISIRGMQVEDNPEVNFGVVQVITVYPGAGPDEVNTLVTRKIEEAVSGVSGMREVTSQSQEGLSVVTTQFEIGTDMDVALNDLRAKVDASASELPVAVEKPTINKFDTASFPILYLVVKSSVLSGKDLRDLADDKLKDRFARIPGVSSVGVSGGDVREIQVRVRKDSLLAYGIGIDDLQRAVSSATLNIPSGRVVDGPSEYSVRVLGEFKTIDDIKNMELSVSDPNNPMAKGKLVKMSDVADVVDAVAERRAYSRLNGADSVLMVIQKARAGNAIEISAAAKEVMKKIEADFKTSNLQFVTTDDSATYISESLNDLYIAIVLGIFLVAAIVYLFLHNFRGTLIVALAIPTSILSSFIGMKLLGFTINTMTMLAMSLAVGVLVDDAIVVIENIYRHLRMGEEPRHAALHGRAEIGLAAMAITLADVVVFLPIGFMGGILGQFFRPLGLSYAIAVIVSLFVSFTLTPMLASRWYKAGEDMEHPAGGFAAWFEHTFGRLSNFYRRALTWSLNHRWFVFSLGNLALVAVIVMIGGSMYLELDKALEFGMVPMFAVIVVAALAVLTQALAKLRAPGESGGFPLWLWIVPYVIAVAVFFVKQDMAVPLAIVFTVMLVGAKLLGPETRVKPQIILYAALIGLILPVSALFGHMSAKYWKGSDIFTFQFFPYSDTGVVDVRVQLPPGSSLAETGKVVEKIEKIVEQHPDKEYVLSSVGTQSAGVFSSGNQGSNYGSVLVSLNDKKAIVDTLAFWKKPEGKLRTRSDTAVAADLLQRIGRIPEAEVFVSNRQSMGFGAPIQISFASDNRAGMLEYVSDVKRRLKAGAIQGLINPDISSKPGKPELRAIPDRTKVADAGVSNAQVANTLRILYEGNNDTKFRVSGKEYDIRVMMDRRDRDNPEVLANVPVTFRQGNPVYLNQVATLSPGFGIDKIDRRNRAEEVVLSADLLPGYAAGTVQQNIDQFLNKEADKQASLGITFRPLGQQDFQNREGPNLFSALGLGLVLVYMLLASLYNNTLYPLIVQMAQPQAMVGALLALMIADQPMNLVGFIGLITLVGLVGKNAILLVDYTNTLRSRGLNRHDALVEAGPTRLRPIMMTTMALILSMTPIALAIGRGSEFRSSIGITIIGGIILSTLLTLLVIPCSYTIFDDISMAFARARHHDPAKDADLSDEATAEKSEDDADLVS